MDTGSLRAQRAPSNRFWYASTIVRWMVEPSATLDEKQRRRMRLLAAFLLLLAINFLISAMAMKNASNSVWPIVLACAAILVISYILSRTRYYRLAIVSAVIIPAVPIMAMIFHSDNPAHIPYALPWSVLPLLISSLLLSLRYTIIVAVSYIVLIALLIPFSAAPVADLSQTLSIMFMIFFLVVAITAARQHDQAEIEHQLAERRWAEEKLRESEEKYRAVFEQAVDSIALIDLDTGEILDFNDRAHENLGYTREEFAKLNLTDIDASAGAENVKQGRNLTREKGANVLETKHRTKNGEIQEVYVSAKFIRIGGKTMVINIWHDITESKQVEEKLRESEEKYRAIFEQAADSFVLIDVETEAFVDFNDRAHENLGYSREEFARLKVTDIDVIESAEMAKERRENMRILGIDSFETKHQTKDGGIRNVLVNRKSLNINGRSLVMAVWHDITERRRAEEKLRESEEKYRAIFEQAADSIVLVDIDTAEILDFNDRAYENLGYTREEFSKLKISDIDVVKSTEEMKRYIKESTKKGMGFFETKHKTKDGERRNILVKSRTFHDNSNKNLVLGIWHDITESKRAEEKLNQALANQESANKQLAVLNKEMEAFSYSVSHDLRSPLRTIDGFSQALLEDYRDKVDEQGQDYLQRVRAASQRMGRLIDDLLKLSRLSRSEMHQEEVDLSTLAEEIAAELQQTQPERKVEFVISQGLAASGDRRLVKIAMENLLGNAWKFTGKCQQAKIEVGMTRNGGRKAYFVRDNGAGFDMNFAGKLFGAFQRLHDTADFPGTGIGLATVQRIVHRHGGSIWAEGAVGKGATFYFTLN